MGSLLAAAAGGRWLGLALYVSISESGSAFDYVNAAIAIALLALLFSVASRHAKGGAAALRALSIVIVLALLSPMVT